MRERKKEVVLRRLIRSLEEAYRYVPYYKQCLDKHGISPRDIRSFADLAAVPETRREDLIHFDLETRTSRRYTGKALLVFNTTGSTGIPLILHRSRREDFIYHYQRFRIMTHYGLRMRDKMVKIGVRIQKQLPLSWSLIQSAGFYRQKQIQPDESPENTLTTVLNESPDILTGNSSVVCRIARLMDQGGFPSRQIKFIVTGAEALTPEMRRTIRKGFTAPVYDNYESMESGPLAWECPETGLYHICEDHVILEVVNGGRPVNDGETGDALVTTLRNRVMPFIRYRLNDRVTMGPTPCPCGFPASTLRCIDGRKTDFLCLPDGREVFASAFAHLIQDNSSWMAQYQVVQEREDKVVLRTLPLRKPKPEELEDLIRSAERFLGPEVQFRVEMVEELVAGPGGKLRVLRSLLKSEYDP